ncbi:MAG: phosphate ABC transporter permease subunit PstC [Gammaproteobacteria bacterium]|nr:phosphate ABC transporter permease subunit PstC [Gammaproteobacteria bacterium]
MQLTTLLFVLLLLSSLAYYFGRKRAVSVSGGQVKDLHSRPGYYGFYTVLWCLLPSLLVFSSWLAMEDQIVTQLVVQDLPEHIRTLPDSQLSLAINDIKNTANGSIVSGKVDSDIEAAVSHYSSLYNTSRAALAVLVLLVAIIGLSISLKKINPSQRARNAVENILKYLLIACSTIAIFTTIGIVLSVLFEAIRFFQMIPPLDFLFGLNWSPQTAIRADQVGSSGSFGAIPLFTGTMLISFIALLVAVPIGLMAAIYLSEYANSKVRAVVKPLLEVLAGIPTVVYGFFAALTVAPLFREFGTSWGLEISSESALVTGLVMGVMIIPFVSSLSDDVINAVPQAMRDGSYGLGATQSETIRRVIIPAALPGIVGGVLLAASRAIGETMIVVMAAGLAANLTANPLEAVTTVTVQIVTLLVGDQEFDSAKTLAAFALGLMLFVTTLFLNVIALHVVRKYREQYE